MTRNLSRDTWSDRAEYFGKDERVLSRETCERVVKDIASVATGGGEIEVMINCWWHGELRWARNRVNMGADRRNLFVNIRRQLGRGVSTVYTNQLDVESLRVAVRAAERQADQRRRTAPPDFRVTPPVEEEAKPAIWSDNTYNSTAEERGELVRVLVDDAEAVKLLAAGYMEMRAGGRAYSSSAGQLTSYHRLTQAQCTMTVRHPEGLGSGWAGASTFDWKRIDAGVLAKRALEKCITSLNPVRVEPGRYTVVLEPQAVCDIVDVLWAGRSAFERSMAESGMGAFTMGADHALGVYRTKLGLKVVDERITLSHDLNDPELGVLPVTAINGNVIRPITWIERGVLKSLVYTRNDYSLPMLNDDFGALDPGSYRMSGGNTTVDEMIASTKRGLLVTRFFNLTVLDPSTSLATGVTRDGLWLIENGKISRAVKNMRITESPLFVLNQIDQLGPVVPVFRSDAAQPSLYGFNLRPAIVPPIKARDFSFTATIDAV